MMQKNSPLATNFNNFPLTSFWRLFIDGNRQGGGPLVFDEKEPGYLKSLQNAFDFAAKNMRNSITVEFLVALQEKTIESTSTKYITGYSSQQAVLEPLPKGIRKDETSFGVVMLGPHQNATFNGLKGLLEEIATGSGDYSLELFGRHINAKTVQKPVTDSYVQEIMTAINASSVPTELWCKLKDPRELKIRMERAIDAFYQEIDHANTDYKKKLAIARCVHRLELIHPFDDANCRTFVLQTAQILLMANGFSPAIFENPNRFDLYSPEELVIEIDNGMRRFRELKETSDQPLPGRADDRLFYLNDVTALLLANQAAFRCAHWPMVNESEKVRALDTIQSALLNLSDKALKFYELEMVSKLISDALNKAIYKKDFYQVSFFSKGVNDYGIHFESNINRLIQRNSLSSEQLTTSINASVFPNTQPTSSPSARS